MTTNKGTADTETQAAQECCMCGDCGFSEELFQCKVCQFRSQHRYCSNLYPTAVSYGTCNWCLRQKEDIKEKSPKSSNSSSSYRNNGSGDDENKNKKTRNGISPRNSGGKKGQKGSAHHLQLKNPSKKQQRSTEARSPPPTSPSVLVSTRKRIITNGALEEKLRITRSEDISNRGGVITRQVFRNRVRRYKLLDEVSS
ncbi:hypothetical protein L6164_016016 [Bauhinia variegata]|uniref:Uncharacterized protein n=1 Tax=Bauhinia variegata TaxID=167791 RepID=A0ACB9NN01_BAUVA|nr:hypothetical protein L6164_016016 [Bauhinia variegata]